MLTFKQKLNIDPALFEIYGGSPAKTVFFDIETTGFSRTGCFIYLICVGYLEDGAPTLLQWFSEAPDDEPKVISSFIEFIKGAKLLVHFNGSSFDVPFVEARAELFGIQTNFAAIKQADLQHCIVPVKFALVLGRCRQKDVEVFLGINREDIYNGGELIEVYKQYLGRSRYDKLTHGTPLATPDGSGLPTLPRTPSEALLSLLLLHNAEDVEGMIKISPLYPITMLMQGKDAPCKPELELTEESFILRYRFNTGISRKFTVSFYKKWPIYLSVSDNGIEVAIDIFTGTLKHFFSDYRNYFYLPNEDMAVHKSVGSGVDKTRRKNAKPETCYVKKAGIFVPLAQRGLSYFAVHSKKSMIFTEADKLATFPPEEVSKTLLAFLSKR